MKTALIGRGAIGILYAMQMRSHGTEPDLLADPARKARYEREDLLVNGEKTDFHYVVPDGTQTYDLILIMTKNGGLQAALETIAPAVNDNTILLSCLNGISSEDVVRARFPGNPVIRTIVQGMDTVCLQGACRYSHIGEILIGAEKPEDEEVIGRLVRFFASIQMPCRVCEDIIASQWNKLMLNCGVNQICAAYGCGYGGAVGEHKDRFVRTMQEVKSVANAKGIALTDADIDAWVRLCETLDPDAMPSMAQDIQAGRPTELALFSGTVMPMANKLGIPVPELEELAHKIEQIEQKQA